MRISEKYIFYRKKNWYYPDFRSDLEQDPDPEPDPDPFHETDTRIRIHIKMKRIRNTAFYYYHHQGKGDTGVKVKRLILCGIIHEVLFTYQLPNNDTVLHAAEENE